MRTLIVVLTAFLLAGTANAQGWREREGFGFEYEPNSRYQTDDYYAQERQRQLERELRELERENMRLRQRSYERGGGAGTSLWRRCDPGSLGCP